MSGSLYPVSSPSALLFPPFLQLPGKSTKSQQWKERSRMGLGFRGLGLLIAYSGVFEHSCRKALRFYALPGGKSFGI